MSANAQWPPAQILAYALAHVAHFRVSDLKALLASLGAARGTSQWNKSALLAKVTSELTAASAMPNFRALVAAALGSVLPDGLPPSSGGSPAAARAPAPVGSAPAPAPAAASSFGPVVSQKSTVVLLPPKAAVATGGSSAAGATALSAVSGRHTYPSLPAGAPAPAPALGVSESAKRAGIALHWSRPSTTSVAAGRFPRRACVCSGIIWPWGAAGATTTVERGGTTMILAATPSPAAAPPPPSLLSCATPGCGAVYHAAHVGVTRPLPRGVRWRCLLCRAAAAMPGCELEALLAPPRTLRARDGGLMRFEWDSATVGRDEPGRSVRLLCLVGSDAAITCQWPISAQLTVNGVPIAVPRSAPDARSAPLLDVTSVVTRGANWVTLSAPPSAEVLTYGGVLVVVRTADRGAVARGVLNTRTLPPLLAAACVRAAFAPSQPLQRGGGGGGGRCAVDIASVWALEQAARDIGGNAAHERALLPAGAGGGAWGAAATAMPSLSWSASALGSASAAAAASPPPSLRATARADGAPVCGSGGVSGSNGDGGVTANVDDDDDDDDDDDPIDALAAPSLSLSLRDPNTRAPIRLPVRGDACEHLQPFDLGPFLTLNSGAAARWRCPVCAKVTMPSQLWLDSALFAGVLVPLSRGATAGRWADADAGGGGGAVGDLETSGGEGGGAAAEAAAAAPTLHAGSEGASASADPASADSVVAATVTGAASAPPPSERAAAALRQLSAARYGGRPPPYDRSCACCLRVVRTSRGQTHCAACGAATAAATPVPAAPAAPAVAAAELAAHGIPQLVVPAAAAALSSFLPLSSLPFALPTESSCAPTLLGYTPTFGVPAAPGHWHAAPHDFGRHAVLIGAPLPLGDGVAMRPSVAWAAAAAALPSVPGGGGAAAAAANGGGVPVALAVALAPPKPGAGGSAAAAAAAAAASTFCGPLAVPECGVTLDVGDDADVRPLTVELLPDGTWRLPPPLPPAGHGGGSGRDGDGCGAAVATRPPRDGVRSVDVFGDSDDDNRNGGAPPAAKRFRSSDSSWSAEAPVPGAWGSGGGGGGGGAAGAYSAPPARRLPLAADRAAAAGADVVDLTADSPPRDDAPAPKRASVLPTVAPAFAL